MVSFQRLGIGEQEAMPTKLKLDLNAEERKHLERWVKNPPRPHLRRKAWALLLLAEGKAAYEVAKDRRVRAHRTTISVWLSSYLAEGLEGLKQKPGQGRKAAFSPSISGECQSRT
jgi:hypothetical protein